MTSVIVTWEPLVLPAAAGRVALLGYSDTKMLVDAELATLLRGGAKLRLASTEMRVSIPGQTDDWLGTDKWRGGLAIYSTAGKTNTTDLALLTAVFSVYVRGLSSF